MPVQFDSPAGKSGGVVFDEQPKGSVVFDEPAASSPYTEVIKEAQDFAKAKAEEPTLRQAITSGVGGTIDAMPNPAVYKPSKTGLMGLRIGVPLTAGLTTGGLGILPAMAITGAAGGLAETGAQGLEVAGGQRDSLSLPQIGAAGIINAFPGIPLTRIASPLLRGGIRVAEGAGLGAAYPAIESGLEGKLPQIEDVGRGALFGAGIGLLPGAVELAGGRTFGRAATDLSPSELETMGRVMREPIPDAPAPPASLPEATAVPAAELDAMKQASVISGNEVTATRDAGNRSVANLDAGISSEKVRALGERMMGKSPQDQLSILDQELRLQKDYLTEAEQRAGLDMKIALKQQIDQQKALEQAAKAEQDAAKAAEKAQQAAVADAQAAATPPAIPKSQQILEDSAKPPPLANVATEVATQTKQSPFALQAGINKMAQVEPPVAAAPNVPQIEPVNIGPRDASVSTGDGVPTAKEQKMLAEQKRLVEGHLAPRPVEVVSDQYTLKAPRPLAESLGTVRDALAYRQERIDNYKNVLRAEIGLDEAQAERLASLLSRDRDTGRFERTLTKEQQAKLESFFDGPMNQKGGPLEQWNDSGADLTEIAEATDRAWLADKVVGSLGNVGRPPSFEPSDRFLSPILALNRLKEIGATWEDVFNEVLAKTRRMGAGNDAGELNRAYSESIKRFADENGIQLPMKTEAIGRRPASAELSLNDAGSDLPPISSMSRDAKRAELDAAGIKTYNGKPLDDANPAEISAAVGKLRRGQLGSERGAVNPGLLTSLSSTGAGAAYGATQGNSPEERARNALLYGSIGLVGGRLAGALINKAISRPIRQYQSQPLKDVAQMLTPLEEKSSLFEKLADAYGNFRYRFNTRFAPIGDAQRALYKATGNTFTPSRYYDLERGFERLAGAPVQAEGEVELLQNVIDKLPKQDVPHLDTYLTLARIEDRLVKTAEENAHLQDAVGRAQAELDSAVKANADDPGVRNASSVVNRRAELNAATKKLSEDFDRKRVGDWSISKARQGLTDLRQHFVDEAAKEVANAPGLTPEQKQQFAQNQGDTRFGALQSAGTEYQGVMRRALQIQVDSGRMSQDLMDRVVASNDFYAPFKVLKYFEEGAPFIKGGSTVRIPSSEQLAKRITGIDDTDVRIGSPTNVAAEQVYKGYILAQKNRKLRELATLSRLDPNGDYVKPLTADMEPRKGYEAVSYLVNGEPKRLEVARPIAKALTGIDATDTDIIMRVLGKTAGAFKLGATGLNVPFNIANAGIFDPLRLATISRYGFRGPQDFLYTMYEWPKALFSSARGNLFNSPDALYEQWIKSGAAGSTLARQLTPEAFAFRLPKDTKAGEIIANTNGWLETPIKVAGLISNTLEETTKLLGLERATRIERLDKLTPQERTHKWDEIVTELRNYAGSPDFARAGVSMKPLNILFPFLNARWQGALADTARLNPFRQGNAADAGAAWARLTSLVGIPAAGLAYYNLSTPENERDYLQIPKTERENYFHIPVNVGKDGKPTILDTGKGYYFNNKDGVPIRGYYRIPKREFPGLVANTFEDFMQYAKSQHPDTFAKMAANFGENTAATISPLSIQGDSLGERALSAASGVNPLVRLPLEVGLNQNLFNRQPIVPRGREEASPDRQFSPTTPQIYKDVAGALPEAAPEFLRSPAKLQHITEGFTGGFARQFAAPRLSPGNPAGDSSPLLGRFYRSEHVESEDLLRGAKDAERGRANQRIDAQEVSTKLAAIIESKGTPEEKQKALSDAAGLGLLTPDVQNYLKEDLMDAQRGLTYEDRVVKRSYSVAGGFRAKYFADKLKGMSPDERTQYLQDQFNKGLLTRDVQGQLAQMLQRR